VLLTEGSDHGVGESLEVVTHEHHGGLAPREGLFLSDVRARLGESKSGADARRSSPGLCSLLYDSLLVI